MIRKNHDKTRITLPCLFVFVLLVLPGSLLSAAQTNPPSGPIRFYLLSSSDATATNAGFAFLKIETGEGNQGQYLRAYPDATKASRTREWVNQILITKEMLNTPIRMDRPANGFTPGKKTCIAQDVGMNGQPAPGRYVVATFPAGMDTSVDSVLGGICNGPQASLFTFSGTLPQEQMVKQFTVSAVSVASGYFVKVLDGQTIIIPSPLTRSQSSSNWLLAKADGTPITYSVVKDDQNLRLYAVVTSFGENGFSMRGWLRQDAKPTTVQSEQRPTRIGPAGPELLNPHEGIASIPQPPGERTQTEIATSPQPPGTVSPTPVPDEKFAEWFKEALRRRAEGGTTTTKITPAVKEGTAAQTNFYIVSSSKPFTETMGEAQYTFEVKGKTLTVVRVGTPGAKTLDLETGLDKVSDVYPGVSNRRACIGRRGSDRYVMATFPAMVGSDYENYAIGGVCSPGALAFEFTQLDRTPKDIGKADARYEDYAVQTIWNGPNAEFKLNDGKKKPLLQGSEGNVGIDKPRFKKAEANRKNGLKSEARVYAAIAVDGSASGNTLIVWLRDELVPQGLVDLFAYSYNKADYPAAQSTHETNWVKVNTLKAFNEEKLKPKESVVICFRTNADVAANPGQQPKVEFVKNDGTTEPVTPVTLELAGRCKYMAERSGKALTGFSMKEGKFTQVFIEPDKLRYGTYQITHEGKLKPDLAKAVRAEVMEPAKAEKMVGEERRLKISVSKPFSGIQSKNKARVLFVINPVTDDEKADYEKQQTSAKRLAAYGGLKPATDGKDKIKIAGIKEADGVILYVNDKLLNQEFGLGGGWAPDSLGRKFGFNYKSTYVNAEGYIDLYVPELDAQSEAYRAFTGSDYQELLARNVDSGHDTAVFDWWNAPASVAALDTPPRAFAPVREYEKVCGLGSDVIEYFQCKSGKWTEFNPNIELPKDAKKKMNNAQLKKLVEDKTREKVKQLAGFTKADEPTASLRNSMTLADFTSGLRATCTGDAKIFVDHVKDVGLYKTPRFYTLWKNLLDVLAEDGDFLKNQVNNGKLRVRVRPLNSYTSDNAQKNELAYGKPLSRLGEFTARMKTKSRQFDQGRMSKSEAQEFSFLYVLNGYFGNLPLHPFTFAFHRLPQASRPQTRGIIQTHGGVKFQIVPLANQFKEEKEKKEKGIELLKEYLHPIPPKGDQPLSSASVKAYMKKAFPLVGANDSYEDVAAVLEIRVKEKTGMRLSGYAFGGDNEVPKSSREADGKKTMSEGFLTQMECTDSTVNSRYDTDPETGSTFERKEPLNKKGCINLPLEDADKAYKAGDRLVQMPDAKGDQALDVLKACRALHSYYYQDFGVTKELKTKPGEAKDRIVLNNLDLSKKFLYDITLCPDVESCGAAPTIQSSALVETKLYDTKPLRKAEEMIKQAGIESKQLSDIWSSPFGAID
ncbi:hypothetical protein HYV43_01510 [Candidatus Micrarchaeota archaeon]|nr:hypothetical protein [Candidatus Micrarchaeota archaeon]